MMSDESQALTAHMGHEFKEESWELLNCGTVRRFITALFLNCVISIVVSDIDRA